MTAKETLGGHSVITKEALGPWAYENWKRSLRGYKASGAYEFPLYSDANIEGNALDCGPYAVTYSGLAAR